MKRLTVRCYGNWLLQYFMYCLFNVAVRTKIWSRVPTGPETKYDCADEGQKQITALLQGRCKYPVV
jgi:hypothetical protein